MEHLLERPLLTAVQPLGHLLERPLLTAVQPLGHPLERPLLAAVHRVEHLPEGPLPTAVHRVGHPLEGPQLAAAETHEIQDSTATRKMMTEEATVMAVTEVVPRAVGRILNETPGAMRTQAMVGAIGTATVVTPAAAEDAQIQNRNQNRNQNRQTRILTRKKNHQALKKAATRVKIPAEQPAGHDRIRGTVFVVDVREPILVPLVKALQPLRTTQPQRFRAAGVGSWMIVIWLESLERVICIYETNDVL